MNREQEEMQFLTFGIYNEACKIMYSRRRLLGQISLVLILPLSVIFLVHMEVSDLLFSNKIVDIGIVLDDTQAKSSTYNIVANVLSSEWATFWLFKAAYFPILFILSLPSTSVVVYTIACIYTGREVDFKKAMSVVPKVWKRLMATFFCYYLFFFVYIILAIVIPFIWIPGFGSTKVFVPILFVFIIMFFVGFVCMTIVWQLASVVTVLEDTYGFGAMIKSKALTQRKMGVAAWVFLRLYTLFAIILVLFTKLVVMNGVSLGVVSRVGFGVLCLLLHFVWFLIGLVVQTLLYFVCKSYRLPLRKYRLVSSLGSSEVYIG